VSDTTIAAAVIVGLAVGIAFFVVLSLATASSTRFTSPPVMSLIVNTDDVTQTYNTLDSAYCGRERCDFLLFARVWAASPEIIITDRSSEMAFRAGHLGQKQPDDLTFDIKKFQGNANGIAAEFVNTSFQLQKVGERRYLLPDDMEAGTYLINVIAAWAIDSNNTIGMGNQDADYRYSLHRFNVIVR